jgi:hypothetical protein
MIPTREEIEDWLSGLRSNCHIVNYAIVDYNETTGMAQVAVPANRWALFDHSPGPRHNMHIEQRIRSGRNRALPSTTGGRGTSVEKMIYLSAFGLSIVLSILSTLDVIRRQGQLSHVLLKLFPQGPRSSEEPS